MPYGVNIQWIGLPILTTQNNQYLIAGSGAPALVWIVKLLGIEMYMVYHDSIKLGFGAIRLSMILVAKLGFFDLVVNTDELGSHVE